jgi:hypothetical protein
MFINELAMYIVYLRKEIQKAMPVVTEKQIRYFYEFKANLQEGISYYKVLVPKLTLETRKYQDTMQEELLRFQTELERLFSHDFPGIFSEGQGASA